MILSIAVLATALLFGGMTLYSFGFAACLFTALPADAAGQALRRAFPSFYLFVIVTAIAAAVCLWPHDPLAAALIALVALTTVPSRQLLMPAINRATALQVFRRSGAGGRRARRVSHIFHGIS